MRHTVKAKFDLRHFIVFLYCKALQIIIQLSVISKLLIHLHKLPHSAVSLFIIAVELTLKISIRILKISICKLREISHFITPYPTDRNMPFGCDLVFYDMPFFK